MATADSSISDLTSPPGRSGYALLAVLVSLPPEQLETLVSRLSGLFGPDELLIATQSGFSPDAWPGVNVVAAPATSSTWSLTAADFVSAYELAQKHDARHILLLGPESGSLSQAALRQLTNSVLAGTVDLALPHYQLPVHAGLLNSAILYPLTRALFATRTRFPIAIDMAVSLRMAERLAAGARRFTSIGQSDALLWPVAEAVVAGFSIGEFEIGARALPQPPDPDVRTILALVAGSLFADIEFKAAYWQRPRRLPPAWITMPSATSSDGSSDVASMVEAFRLAYSNLLEIWGLVLPPQSLLGLKRLSLLDTVKFQMPESLWARIVYDFVVAYRLRTINRSHLLGALIPLYLAWVAGHINVSKAGTDPERHIEAVAAAFDADKPYLVSRWRWPDRFNP